MSVFAGAQAPEQLRLPVANAAAAEDPLDFTTVTAFTLNVYKPGGEHATWDVTPETQTATELVLVHVFDLIDVPIPGTYKLVLEMTVSGGVRRAGPGTMTVFEF